jgi:hypothetical protein
MSMILISSTTRLAPPFVTYGVAVLAALIAQDLFGYGPLQGAFVERAVDVRYGVYFGWNGHSVSAVSSFLHLDVNRFDWNFFAAYDKNDLIFHESPFGFRWLRVRSSVRFVFSERSPNLAPMLFDESHYDKWKLMHAAKRIGPFCFRRRFHSFNSLNTSVLAVIVPCDGKRVFCRHGFDLTAL